MSNHNVLGRYPLYFKLTGLVFALLTALLAVLGYLLWPGLIRYGMTVAVSVEIVLALIPVVCWFMWGLMLLATTKYIKIHFILLRLSNRWLYAFFPAVILVGRILGISKDRISQSLIDLINYLVELNLYKVPADRVLLLTPHCLQQSDCVHKVTTDVHNCKRCGRCQVGTLLDIADTYGCHFLVVTGGTLARLMIKKVKPKAIVAIACERDLVSGMNDVFPIPVIGVLNERPCGPCCNTRVDTDRIKEAVEKLING
ncbi:MAG: DUF116 domain-containing protein [Veillonella sp.]|uniref:DUF116 domain-containing protein n=1 Tax=Veillonella sp. TaxID=1926307 RepID=UPI0025FB15D6|nr:DUF116 domain-containing protein [Veillonella sp.]MBS4912708.1 DUF116 domain-containing protein [Veillonella sp.]